MRSTEVINIDPEVMRKLRDYCFLKYCTTYGKLKREAEMAILKHIGDESNE